MGLLEVAESDLARRDVRGEREDGGHGPVGVVEAVDEVQVAGAAGAGAGRQLSGDLCLRSGGERGRLLVPDLDPVDVRVAADRVDDRVETVADHPVQAFDACPGEDVDELLRHVLLGHGCALPLPVLRARPAVLVPGRETPAGRVLRRPSTHGARDYASQTPTAVRSSAYPFTLSWVSARKAPRPGA